MPGKGQRPANDSTLGFANARVPGDRGANSSVFRLQSMNSRAPPSELLERAEGPEAPPAAVGGREEELVNDLLEQGT